MRDAMGGTVTIVIVVVFIVFALGYMAFNVNYTKAFRMKDKIISVYDNYNGECTDKCKEEIVSYAQSIGYSNGSGTNAAALCPSSDYTALNNLYCIIEVKCDNMHEDFCAENSADGKERKSYKIATRITIDIPAFKNVLNYNFFYVYGDTRTYKY